MTARSVLACEVVWADVDLLEVEARVAFDAWSGVERAYVTREELDAFGDQLEAVARGDGDAMLDGGQVDLSYVRLAVFEYGMARRTAVRVELGRAPDTVTPGPGCESELRFCVPVERGQLMTFGAQMHRIVKEERGVAELPLLDAWPT